MKDRGSCNFPNFSDTRVSLIRDNNISYKFTQLYLPPSFPLSSFFQCRNSKTQVIFIQNFFATLNFIIFKNYLFLFNLCTGISCNPRVNFLTNKYIFHNFINSRSKRSKRWSVKTFPT